MLFLFDHFVLLSLFCRWWLDTEQEPQEKNKVDKEDQTCDNLDREYYFLLSIPDIFDLEEFESYRDANDQLEEGL